MAPLKTTIFPMLEHSAQVLLEILGFPRLDIQFKATLPSSPGCLNQYQAEFLSLQSDSLGLPSDLDRANIQQIDSSLTWKYLHNVD